MTPTLNAVHPVLMSSDPEHSIDFFQRLGFAVAFKDQPSDPRYVVITRDAVTLHLQWQHKSQWACSHDRPTYRFTTQEVDALFRSFQAAGAISASQSPYASPRETPWGTYEFHVLDPDGNGLQFYRPL